MGNSLNELDSTFRPMAAQLIQNAEGAGLDLLVIDTGRTLDQQTAKLQQGVSWTKYSMHEPQPPEGLSKAIDLVPKSCLVLKYWGWNGTVENSDPAWGKLIALAKAIPGIKCGADWPNNPPHSRPDPGHFEQAPLTDQPLPGVEETIT